MAEDTSPHELACLCGGAVLDLRGLKGGAKVTCSYCGRVHTVPDVAGAELKQSQPVRQEVPSRGDRKDRHDRLMAELEASAPKDELADLLAELDKKAPIAKRLVDRSESGRRPSRRAPRSWGGKWLFIVIYLLVATAAGVSWYVRTVRGIGDKQGELIIDWDRYPWWVWLIVVLFGAVLGLFLHLAYVYFFVYRPKKRRAKRSSRDGAAGDEAVGDSQT